MTNHTALLPVDDSTNLPIRLEGRARFLEDRGEVKTPGLLREAITALRADAPEAQGEVERVLALVPNAYADIKLNLPDAVICYGMDTGGCVREAGCEDTCLMLATYRKGVEFGARAALASGAGDEG